MYLAFPNRIIKSYYLGLYNIQDFLKVNTIVTTPYFMSLRWTTGVSISVYLFYGISFVKLNYARVIVVLFSEALNVV